VGVGVGVVVGAAVDGSDMGGGLEGLRRGGRRKRGVGAVAVPGAEGVVVGCGAAGDDVAGVGEIEGALGEAGLLDGVDVAGLESEGHGLGEVDAGVFHVAVDEERDGDEAGGGGLGEVAGPLVHSYGAGDFFRRRDLVHLGTERQGEADENGDGSEARHCPDVRRAALGSCSSVGKSPYCGEMVS